MGFWQNSFLAKRRQEWMRDIGAVQYQANGTWYNGKINDMTLSGDTLKINWVTTDNLALTITAIRILDRDGNVAGYATDSIAKSATQGMLYCISVKIIDEAATIT
mgnify:CR=1 FL=1